MPPRRPAYRELKGSPPNSSWDVAWTRSGTGVAELLGDAGVSMVAVDAPSIDPLPHVAVNGGEYEPSDSAHVRLLTRLGLYVGELFALDDLAANGEMTYEELQELAVHDAVYVGWALGA